MTTCSQINSIQEDLKKVGILKDDPRLKYFFKNFLTQLKKKSTQNLEKPKATECLTLENLSAKKLENFPVSEKKLISRAQNKNLIIPNFSKFTELLKFIFEEVKKINKGKLPNYIPELQSIDKNKFAISICTIDGQRFSLGDCAENFSMQSCCKPFNYLLALEEHGEEFVHKYIGKEPSGYGFNKITLDKENRPHNPMINSGAIMNMSLIQSKKTSKERLEHILKAWENSTAGIRPTFNQEVFLSEKEHAHQNFCLAYFMQENQSFPKDTDLLATLNLYMKTCSLELNTDALAIAAATLARSGQCPLTGKEVFESNNVKNCLSLMYSCGMYDFSGDFAFTVGLPAKSGVGGGLMLVIPNLMGVCIWSPLLDEHGNSARGLDVAKWLVEIFNFHIYSNLVLTDNFKIDPRLQKNQKIFNTSVALCLSAAEGDLPELKQLLSTGIDVNTQDYSGQTALHMACSKGHLDVVKFLISLQADLLIKNNWGKTPLDEAKKEKHKTVLNFLTSND